MFLYCFINIPTVIQVFYLPILNSSGEAFGIIKLSGDDHPEWADDDDDGFEENETTRFSPLVVRVLEYYVYRISIYFKSSESIPFSGHDFTMIKRLMNTDDPHLSVQHATKVGIIIV
jgi:hypothetical protein